MDNDNLLKRFDLDNNGVLDMQEWMLARSAAKREAEKRMNEALAEPDTNFMLQPQDGRLFLISNSIRTSSRYVTSSGPGQIFVFLRSAGRYRLDTLTPLR